MNHLLLLLVVLSLAVLPVWADPPQLSPPPPNVDINALPECPPAPAPQPFNPSNLTPAEHEAMREHVEKTPGRVQPTCKPVEQPSALMAPETRPGMHPVWLKYGIADAEGLMPNTAHLPPCPPSTPEESNAPMLPHMTREEIKVWYQLHPPTCDPPWEKEKDKQDQEADLREAKIPDCPPVSTWQNERNGVPIPRHALQPPFECMDKDLKKAQKEIRDGRRVKRHGG